MLSDLRATAEHVERAKVPEDVFGALPGSTPTARLRALVAHYRRVVACVHPDKFDGSPHQALAKDTFVKLTEWRAKAERKISAGTYGDGTPAPSEVRQLVIEPQVIKTPRREYLVNGVVAQGDIADLYACTFEDEGKEHRAVLKVAQSPADNDLLENESKTLSAMYKPKQAEVRFYRYLPKLLDTFVLRSPSRSQRRANVLQLAEGYVSLADVIRAYPDGIDYRDAVWMLKRVFAGLGYVHIRKHVVHGAVLPTHVMVHPTGHGAKLVDWCYSVREWESGGKIKALCSEYRGYYPPEVLKKSPPTPQTDLYMAAKCFVALLGGDVATNQVPTTVPKPFQAFLGSCLLTAQSKRPDDAWRLHEDLDELLTRLVGRPKYRPLIMPAK